MSTPKSAPSGESPPPSPAEPSPALPGQPPPPGSTTVVIVGAGPTGLTLASFLAGRNIPFVIVDRRQAGSITSRGAVIHSRTLEVLDRIGVGSALVERGVVMSRFTMRRRHRAMLTVPFTGLPGRHNHSVSVPQNITEEVFEARLAASGDRIHRGWEVVDLQTRTAGSPGDGSMPAAQFSEPTAVTEQEVTVTVVDQDGHRRQIRADFLVGCDGLHSRVRELAGIGFTGSRYAQTFEMADVRMDWPLARDGIDLTMAPDGLLVVFPLPDDQFRIIAAAQACSPPGSGSAGDPGTQLTIEQIQELLDRRSPQVRRSGGSLRTARVSRPLVREVLWSKRFSIENRLADAFRAGPVFLAGDAAHVYSPAGGQGMNLGIRDGAELAAVLADVVSGQRDQAHLDSYQASRRPLAQDVVALTDRMTRAVTLRGPARRAIRNGLLTILGVVPPVRVKMARKLSGHTESLSTLRVAERELVATA